MVTQASPSVIRPVTPGDLSLGRYGKLGQSSAADTQAWHDVFLDIIAAGGGTVRVPPGVLQIESPAILTADMGTSDVNGISILGSGRSRTVFETQSGLFDWRQASARDIGFLARDLSVSMAAGGNNGDIFYLEQVEGGISRQEDAVFENIAIWPKDRTVDYFTNGIVAKNLFWPTVRGSQIANPYGPGVSTATQHQGNACINVDGSYGPQIIDTKCWGAARGISYVVTANPGGEGGLVRNCVLDSDVGLYAESAGTEPGLDIIQTHFNCAAKGIHLVRKKLVKIRDCLMYAEEADPYTDIALENCQDVSISNMTFFFVGNTSRTNVSADASCARVQSNALHHLADGTAYSLAGSDHQIINPYYGAALDTRVVNTSAGLVVKHLKPNRVRAVLSANAAVSNATPTTVTWDTTSIEEEGNWVGATPYETFVVPANAGINRIKARANIQWTNNSTGGRECWFTVGGVRVEGIGQSRQLAAGSSYQSVETAELDVVGGEVIRLIVQQDSGVSLNIVPGPATWIEIAAVG